MKPERQDPIDPAVADLLAGAQHRQAQRSRPVAERKRAAKEKAKAAKRNRVMLDLPVEIQEEITAMAFDLECPISQVAAALLIIGLAENIDNLRPFRKVSKSPRYTYNLDLSEISKSYR